MTTYSKAELAGRAGVPPAFIDRVIEAGLVTADDDGHFVPGDARRVQFLESLEQEAGIPLDELADAMRRGQISLDFMDAPAFARWASVGPETFKEVSARTGVAVHLLMVVREAIGSAQPRSSDRMREDELEIVPLLETVASLGFRPAAVERMLRVIGDSLRRVAETEAEMWRSEVMAPQIASGMSMAEMGEFTGSESTQRLSAQTDRAVLSVFHAQEAHTWTANIISGLEQGLADAGITSRLNRPSAMCFLDITGYTRLTQERGDRAAAELASDLARLVQRAAVAHGGRPVKWLGDGVMLHFRDPGSGVLAALTMVEGVAGAGLPPAHVGLHAGPVILQEGDYFGQTVNIASRIAEYARPGEVLVSHEVVTASQGAGPIFTEIGPVELKGVSGPVRLYSAHLAEAAGA